jgi:hypothetical protein
MCLSETNVSLLAERGSTFLTVVAYKHLAPNGAKTSTFNNTDRFVARTLETGH